MVKAALVSLGCDKNLTDSENLLGFLRAGGFVITGDREDADVIIVNTCGFIKSAADESAEMLRECAALKANGRLKLVLAVGCLAARYYKSGEMLSFADNVLLFKDYQNIAEKIYEFLNLGGKSAEKGESAGRVVSTGHYAYIKIAEGCDNRCAYCSIPDIRGGYVSFPREGLLEEARGLAAGGVKELIAVAQDTSVYGGGSLPELLNGFSLISGIERIRLMYCYPEHITDALIDEMASNPKICKYLDMPVQHAADRVLSRMGRKSTKAGILKTIEKLRAAMPDITIRTTLMTGFPGESEDDFRELLDFCKAVKFDRVGAFMFSREKGTPAYGFQEQIPENVKKRRFEKLMEETGRISRKRRGRFVGKTLQAFAEGVNEEGLLELRGEHDAPDADGVILVKSKTALPVGKGVSVRITGVTKYDCEGVLINE